MSRYKLVDNKDVSRADLNENISCSSADGARMSVATKEALTGKPILSAGPQKK